MKPNRLLQAATLLVAAAISGYLFAGDHLAARKPPMTIAENANWRAECAACHTLYRPELLPERSWRKLMAGLDRHFGANASLDSATQREVTEFLATNAADHSGQQRGRKIAESIAATETPLAITETRYFIRKHDELHAEIWRRKAIGSKANCGACHPGAEQGSFSEAALRIPK